MRTARAISAPMAAALAQAHDALVTGAAISACFISWNAPRPGFVVRRVAGKQDDGRLRHQRRVERGERVRMSRPAGDERDPRLAGDARPRVGHVHGGGFVPRMHEVEPDVQRRVEHRHDVIARQREDVPHARVGERADQDIGAAHAF